MSYTIFGQKVLSQHLALGTYAAIGLITYGMTRGGGSKAPAPGAAAPAGKTTLKEPEFKAESKEEEDFIRQFLAEAEKEDKKGGH